MVNETTAVVRNDLRRIYQTITGDIANSGLPLFDSPSRISEWRVWAMAVSFVSYVQRLLWEEAKKELSEIRDTGIAANKFFFAREWKKFQYGDPLLVNDSTGRYYYENVDPDKQIIRRLSISNGVNNWVLRVAKEAAGKPLPLDSGELDAFKAYVDLTAPPGPQPVVVSRPSDKIRAAMRVTYDPITPLAQVVEAVEASYLAYIGTIDIEGVSRYYTIRHVDAVQQSIGVKDLVVVSVEAKIEGDRYLPVDRVYEPASGYLELDPDSDLKSLVEFLPER